MEDPWPGPEKQEQTNVRNETVISDRKSVRHEVHLF